MSGTLVQGIDRTSVPRIAADSMDQDFGGLPEWLKGADCKSVGYAYRGSNPLAPTSKLGAGRLEHAEDVGDFSNPRRSALHAPSSKLVLRV